MRVLVLGAAGQVGKALCTQPPADVQVVALERGELDLTDAAALARCLDSVAPAAVVNAAAYTAVDRAESAPDEAEAVNATAVGELARGCAARGLRLVHLSTDFVFDGRSGRPYGIDDVPAPLNVYGASKLAGERLIRAQPGLDWRVVRTAWVYAPGGRNFLTTMLRLMRQDAPVRVVDDQVGTPTSAGSLARCVWLAALRPDAAGLMHFTDAGVASWYDFAVAIHEEALAAGLIAKPATVVPIASADYPTPARRPPYSVLDKSRTLARLGLPPLHWRVCLREALLELAAGRQERRELGETALGRGGLVSRAEPS